MLRASTREPEGPGGTASPRGRGSRHGFTLIEILIAIVVLALSFVGILALLAGTTKVAGEVVEDSFAATLARSVFESLREGARERAFAVDDGPKTVRGFVLIHEGVKDGFSTPYSYLPPPLPKGATDTSALGPLRQSDFAIFLPTTGQGGTSGATVEPYFVFPRPESNAAAVAGQNSSEKDNFFPSPLVGNRGPVYLDVQRVYWLRDRQTAATPTPTGPGPTIPLEAANQYGFAIAVRRSSTPTVSPDTPPPAVGPGLPSSYKPSSGLYEFQVFVYRNFEKDVQSRHHEEVTRFVGLIAVGP